MTAPQSEIEKPEGVASPLPPTAEEKADSMAVAKIGVGDLPPEIRASIAAAKMANAVAAEISKLSWGKSLDGNAARAVAEWGRIFGIDVITEMDILGGRPYLNSRYYLRRLAGLIEAGTVQYAVADHIEADGRLSALAAKGNAAAVAEVERRELARIEFGVAEEAASAVVFRVKLRSMEREVTGCKWAGGRDKDPVGNAFPVETAESRAARRCIRQLVGHVPALDAEAARIEAASNDVEELIERSRAQLAADVAEHRKALGHGLDERRRQDEYGGGA